MNSTNNDTYPVVVRTRSGDMMARVNPDRTWSVNWLEVANTAYGSCTEDNAAIWAICTMLLAGRDNFRTSPLTDPHQPWSGIQFEFGYHVPLPTDNAVMALIGTHGVIAYVDPKGVWSVDWPKVIDVHHLPEARASQEGIVPLVGICEALYGAKDNFHTKPMED